jgi:2-oxoglutarate ferredoxin oxidoreductase subunit alpha
MDPGMYRSIMGNQALSYGLIAASQVSKLPLFLGSYPITPASDVLHELSRHKSFGVRTFQAEDEIAAITTAIGASYGGSLGVTTTSGPGMALKAEAMGLAVMLEIPLIICNIQRGGPSTGYQQKQSRAICSRLIMEEMVNVRCLLLQRLHPVIVFTRCMKLYALPLST